MTALPPPLCAPIPLDPKTYTIVDYVDDQRRVVAEIYAGDALPMVTLIGHAAAVVAVESGKHRHAGEIQLQTFLAGVYAAHCARGVWP